MTPEATEHTLSLSAPGSMESTPAHAFTHKLSGGMEVLDPLGQEPPMTESTPTATAADRTATDGAAADDGTPRTRRGRPARPERSERRPEGDPRPRRDDRGDRRGRPQPGPRRLDLSPPRFNVDELAALAGPPVWQAVHDAVILEVTPAVVVIEVRPAGSEPLKAAVKPEELPELTVGTALRVRLNNPPAVGESLPTASVQQARDLDRFEAMAKARNGEGVNGAVVREVKGGYTVALFADDAFDVSDGAVRAFLPASQASLGRFGPTKGERIVGSVGRFAVGEVDLERGNIVVSRRAVLFAERDAALKDRLATLKEGDVVTGTVKSIVAYGAFVDVGGIDALLHREDLAWDGGRGARIESYVKPGQALELKVLQVKDRKLKVGLKQLKPDPWAEVRAAFSEGAVVKGVVVGVADFGVFVKLPLPSNPAEHVEGLIHVSEISYTKVKHPSSRFSIGQEIDVKVLGLDAENRRMSLSTKALEKNPFEAVAQQFPVGTVVKAKVKSLADFGAFLQLTDNVDGMVHIGELSWLEHPKHPSELLTIGQDVEAVVMAIDVAKQRVSCSIKQTQPNPFDAWAKKYREGSRHTLKVIRADDKGAQLEVEPGLSCWCSWRDLLDSQGNAVEKASDAVKQGQMIEVEVRQFDRRFKKVSVSMRAVVEGETRAAYEAYKQQEQGQQKLNPLADKLKSIKPGT
jgi:small subunit ribosomal protein S1